ALVGTEQCSERAERRTRELRVTALLRGTFTPAGRSLHLPAGLLTQRGIQEARLHVAEAVAFSVLLWFAVAQHFIEIFQRAGINQRDPAILQARRAVAGQDETLDVRRRKFFAVRGRQGHLDIEPALARGPDFKTGFEPFEVFGRAVLELFLKRDFP